MTPRLRSALAQPRPAPRTLRMNRGKKLWGCARVGIPPPGGGGSGLSRGTASASGALRKAREELRSAAAPGPRRSPGDAARPGGAAAPPRDGGGTMGALGLAVGIFHYLGLYLQLGAASRPPPWDAPAEGSGERGHRAVGGQRGWGRLPGGGAVAASGGAPGDRSRRCGSPGRGGARPNGGGGGGGGGGGPGGRGGAGFRQHGALRRGGGSAERGLRIGAALRRSVPSASAAGRGAAPSASRAPPRASPCAAARPSQPERRLPSRLLPSPPVLRPRGSAGGAAGGRRRDLRGIAASRRRALPRAAGGSEPTRPRMLGTVGDPSPPREPLVGPGRGRSRRWGGDPSPLRGVKAKGCGPWGG